MAGRTWGSELTPSPPTSSSDRSQCPQRSRIIRAHQRELRLTRYATDIDDCAQRRPHGTLDQTFGLKNVRGLHRLFRARINGNRKINRPRSNSKLPRSKPSKRLLVNQRLFSTRSARRLSARRRRLKKRKGRRRRLPFSGLSKPRKRYRLVPTPRRCFVYISSRVTARRGTSASLAMTRMWAGRLRRGICTRTLERTRLMVCIPLLCVAEVC